MGDATLPHLRVIGASEDERLFGELLETIEGLPTRGSASTPAPMIVAAVGRLAAVIGQLEQRLAAIEAEIAPLHRSRKCPCCHKLSLTVVAAQPHPELGIDGIEQHEVRCGCGYRASRLYDPRDYIR